MDEQVKSINTLPRYQQIAIEIATRIVSGEYKVGQKIYARSTLASQHGVSAETARRAICVLSDLDIVASEKGSGVMIKSYENAEKFVQHQNKRQSIDKIKENIQFYIGQQKTDMENLNRYLTELVSATEHFRSLNPFVPFQVQITKDCVYLGQSISGIRFWQNTGATVVAIHRDNTTLLSPGPYIQLEEDDIVFFVTQDPGPNTVIRFLYPIEE